VFTVHLSNKIYYPTVQTFFLTTSSKELSISNISVESVGAMHVLSSCYFKQV